MVYILGIGNVLMGDDGFGPAAVRAFEAALETDADVEVVDVGTPGLDLMPWFYDADALIIVDTVKSNAPPGTIRIYDKAAILEHAPAVRVGPHDPGVKDALHAVEFAGHGPRAVTLVGVVPQSVQMSTNLSQPVRDAIPAAVTAVAQALVDYGQSVTPRAQPAALPPWWSTDQV